MPGPVLYGVATAAMYLGHPATPMLDAYTAATGVDLGALDRFVTLRWAAQAGYFAYRLAEDVRTGLRAPDQNRAGLEEARTALDKL
jgi:hypothetical protein